MKQDNAVAERIKWWTSYHQPNAVDLIPGHASVLEKHTQQNEDTNSDERAHAPLDGAFTWPLPT